MLGPTKSLARFGALTDSARSPAVFSPSALSLEGMAADAMRIVTWVELLIAGGDAVGNILFLSAGQQMLRIATTLIVAFMPDDMSIGDRSLPKEIG